MSRVQGPAPSPSNPPMRWPRLASLNATLFAALTLSALTLDPGRDGTDIGPAYRPDALPAHVDTAVGLSDALGQIVECADECDGLAYVWSERMPLSRRGVEEISAVAGRLGMPLTLLRTEELYDETSARGSPDQRAARLADALLAAGALAHAPAVVVHDGARVLGPAILGYKRATTYERIVRRRLSGTIPAGDAPEPRALATDPVPVELQRGSVDYEAVGSPGAYFRWVPGRRALAYESGRRIYLLDLDDGESRTAPGFVDFIPTPDGRFFVTPGPSRRGLLFYDTDPVFAAAAAAGDRQRPVQPIYADPRMRDQYPSVGILAREEGRTVYRVLTSWFSGIAYRDYEVRDDGHGGTRVRPRDDPVNPCPGKSLSIPIVSRDGLEVAARDEATGTTKVFGIGNHGRCRVLVDLGVQTSKVAWHRTGRLLAFARPRTGREAQGSAAGEPGIYLFDRDTRQVRRLRGSEEASPLAFPDFVGDDSLVFLVPQAPGQEASTFRVVNGIRSVTPP